MISILLKKVWKCLAYINGSLNNYVTSGGVAEFEVPTDGKTKMFAFK